MEKSDLDFYISDEAKKCTNRYIASFLATYEALIGRQDPEASRIVKDTMNTASRILVAKLTGIEVEPAHASPSRQQPLRPEGS